MQQRLAVVGGAVRFLCKPSVWTKTWLGWPVRVGWLGGWLVAESEYDVVTHLSLDIMAWMTDEPQVKGVMVQNINKLLDRGKTLDNMASDVATVCLRLRLRHTYILCRMHIICLCVVLSQVQWQLFVCLLQYRMRHMGMELKPHSRVLYCIRLDMYVCMSCSPD